jgi:hypothetical protein
MADGVKIQAHYIITHEGIRNCPEIAIARWTEANDDEGWSASVGAIASPEEGFSAHDLDRFAELFASAAKKLRELESK